MGHTIRDALAEDAEAIAALLAELGYPASAAAIPGRLQRMREEPGQSILLAEDGGRVVGLATLIVRHVINADSPFARLAAMVVTDSARGRGVGSGLLAEAERIAREAGCSLIEVTSGLHRPEAHAFYLRHGFEERPRRFVKQVD
jgi:GNAT superfamily N-acetyltransferase